MVLYVFFTKNENENIQSIFIIILRVLYIKIQDEMNQCECKKR